MFLLFLVKMFATHLKRPKRRVDRRTDRTNGHCQVDDDENVLGDIDNDDGVGQRGAWREEQIGPMGTARLRMITLMMVMMLLVIIMMMKEVRGKKNRSGQWASPGRR